MGHEGSRKTVQHKYFTEEKWEKVNPKNKELFKDFIEYMKAADKSDKSIHMYINNIQIFLIWCMESLDNKFFVELKKKDVVKFQNFLVNEQKLSPARVRQIRSSLSSWGNYIMNFEDETYPNYINIINRIKPPALERVLPKTYLEEEQINYLLSKLEEKCKWQQACFVAMAFASGARKEELRQFLISDFTEETLKNGLYKTHILRTKGRGKTGKQRSIFVAANIVDKWLNKWLEYRKENNIICNYLFVSKNDNGEYEQIKPYTFNKWCKTFSKILGVDVFPHAFRSSIASVLKSKGGEITKIQKLLGHNDISTTQIYLKPTDEEDIESLFE